MDDCISAVYGGQNQPFDGEFVVFDTETTGLNAQDERLTGNRGGCREKWGNPGGIRRVCQSRKTNTTEYY